MLAANVCAADFMKRSKHPGLYRVHEGPTSDRLQKLREFLRSVGLSLGGEEEPRPSDYAELAQKVRERPDADLLQTMMLRSMQQAIYSPENSGHFGLAYEAYTHFTSPIRRYPDLLTHRVIKALLRGERYVPLPVRRDGTEPSGDTAAAAGKSTGGRTGKRPASSAKRAALLSTPPAALRVRDGAQNEIWTQYGVLCSANERRADEASRDVEAWLKCQYMRERVGEEFAGRITGVAPFGIFVTLNDLYVDGLVHVSELGGEYFQYNEAAHELRGERTGRRFRLTDEYHVQVSRVDLEARRIEFRPVQRFGLKSELQNLVGPAPARPVRKAAPPKDESVRQALAARKASKSRRSEPDKRTPRSSKRSKRR